MSYSESLFLIFCGALLGPVFNSIGMLNGQEALDYYAEVHQSTWNSLMHTVGMPFTFYGISCWFPALFRLSNANKNRMQECVWTVLFVHYMTIDLFRGMLCLLVYIYPAYLALERTKYTLTDWDLFKHGFMVSFCSLVFQEIVGHWMGGDDPSRVEGIPNAIFYSVFYSTYHLL
jgi:uncharacterized membrane protein YGL010W